MVKMNALERVLFLVWKFWHNFEKVDFGGGVLGNFFSRTVLPAMKYEWCVDLCCFFFQLFPLHSC